jgi:F-type H+-transporting ATPase subunit gamma
MPNTRELRRRIRSVKNTAQITKAMQMVAATKMRKAQNQAVAGRPYNLTLNEAMTLLLPRIQETKHPLLEEQTEGNSAVLLLSTDKALCGSLNTNLFRATLNFMKDQKNTVFYTLGKKGRQFCVRSGFDLAADFENSDLVTFRTASQIAKLVTKSFINHEIKELFIIYPDFVSALRQEPKIVRILPVDFQNLVQTLTPELANKSHQSSAISHQQDNSEFLFEPSIDELLDFILNHFVQVKIFQAMMETKASEHSARMIAMQNATDNAKELVDDLTLSYNQTRQAAITSELLEITSAQAALE